jgi:hypothetical protein
MDISQSGIRPPRPGGIAQNLAVSVCNLERLSEDVLVAVLGRRRPVVPLQPGVNLGGQDLVRDAITEDIEDDVHPDAEVLDVLSSVFDITVDGVLARELELDALVLMLSGGLTTRWASA